MKQTYYSVGYYSGRSNSTSTAFFDTKEAAEKFADHDYRDNVVAHHVSKPETIAKYDELVAMTAFELRDR
ncbi:hypothetical protein SBF1_50032 [Candidatus Desulfosporosinus infrequens]|uniref:Uncharacterized protein n=1 Tax=Candidatus Desulfosporosinus infrequens TaxID=2043169 RepID=A0A2U3LGX9_9FIRM|nr:hypothetical protein SBF1_50032 [Candidatus Desulfosporosinus infrequens]